MVDFRFSNEQTPSNTASVVSLLEKPRLWIPGTDYPDYAEWLGKTSEELETEQKRAMIAFLGHEPVGSVVYQRHKTKPTVLEIKNISVSPDVRGRYVAGFLLRNTEIEGAKHDFPECTEIAVDTKVDNLAMTAFLMAQHYQPTVVTDLYGLTEVADLMFAKTVNE